MTIAQARSITEHATAISDLVAARGISPDAIRAYSLSLHGPHDVTVMIHTNLTPADIPNEYWVGNEECDSYSADRKENGVALTLFASN